MPLHSQKYSMLSPIIKILSPITKINKYMQFGVFQARKQKTSVYPKFLLFELTAIPIILDKQ